MRAWLQEQDATCSQRLRWRARVVSWPGSALTLLPRSRTARLLPAGKRPSHHPEHAAGARKPCRGSRIGNTGQLQTANRPRMARPRVSTPRLSGKLRRRLTTHGRKHMPVAITASKPAIVPSTMCCRHHAPTGSTGRPEYQRRTPPGRRGREPGGDFHDCQNGCHHPNKGQNREGQKKDQGLGEGEMCQRHEHRGDQQPGAQTRKRLAMSMTICK